ncbi:MAG: T9SS type A sorting domain-containing protein [Candidatus Cloacimonetes bacterium]|nr:T9SS type A sorting domain-containing protein [Candidatus Cloacimonadota bacterium]
MYSKKLIPSMTMIMLLTLISVTLFAEMDIRVQEDMREIKEKYRTAFRDFRNLIRFAPNSTRDLAMSEMIFQFIDYDTEDWENSDKSNFSYDVHGRMQAIYHYWWDDYEELWVDHPITTFLNWDDNDNLVELIYHFYEEPYDLVFSVITQTFNANNQITNVIMEFYDEDEEELVLWREMEFYYDNNGFAEWSLMIDYEYMEYERISISYDDSDRFNEILTEYSPDADIWYPSELSLIEYHPNDNSGYQEFQDFINSFALMIGMDDPIWLPQPMFLTETLHDWESGDWHPVERDVFTYYPDNTLESRIYEVYFVEWYPENRIYYLYNVRDQLDMIYLQYYHYFEEEWVDYERYLITMSETSSIEDDYLTLQPFRVANYPNPFNPETTIRFELPFDQKTELSIVNIKGQTVRTLLNELKSAGVHHIVWDGKDNNGKTLSSGVYFYHLNSDKQTLSGKMLLLK